MKPGLYTRYSDIPPYKTKDGSVIRELMHPDVQGNAAQSLAEAELGCGQKTCLHVHSVAEEIYHILAGVGLMHRGGESFEVSPGDTIVITAGTPHCIENVGGETLRFLCACSPPYRHSDTRLIDGV